MATTYKLKFKHDPDAEITCDGIVIIPDALGTAGTCTVLAYNGPLVQIMCADIVTTYADTELQEIKWSKGGPRHG